MAKTTETTVSNETNTLVSGARASGKQKQLEDRIQQLEEQLEIQNLRVASIGGQMATLEEHQHKAGKILARIEAERRSAGKHKWVVRDKRYLGGDGEPVGYTVWSDFDQRNQATQVISEFRKRTRSSWNVKNGPDPLTAELVG
jgi:hypothetical protein